jgi:demethylmenaquinone methyltransferase / 2-methoxy-6-polyprenyl-1,4-benzoquinol methylase
LSVVPYKNDPSGKKQQVARMFDTICGNYDFLNHFLSFGIDVQWRKKAIALLESSKPKLILDVATGTGDFAIQALKLKPSKIVGVDISEGMLEVGRKKMVDRGYDQIIEMRTGDSENLPFEENKFDAITVGFGVRNFENLKRGLSEMLRVLKPGGKVVILEFSRPTVWYFKPLYHFYFRFITPAVGKVFSKDSAAYSYLPDSVNAFPDGKDFTAILDGLGYKHTSCKALTFGISTLYTGTK